MLHLVIQFSMYDNWKDIEEALISEIGNPSGTGAGFGFRDIDWHIDDDKWSNPTLARKIYAVFRRFGLKEGTEFKIHWNHELDLPSPDAEFLNFDGTRHLIIDILPDDDPKRQHRPPEIGVFMDDASDPENLLFALTWPEARALAAKITHVTDIAEFG